MAGMAGGTAAPVPVLVPSTTVWQNWNQAVYLQTTATTTTNMIVWNAWNQNSTSTGTAHLVPVPADVAWAYWNRGYTTGPLVIQNAPLITAWTQWNTTYEETAEQQAEREQRQAQAELRARQAGEARVKANDRAKELLLSLLTPAQAATYAEHGWFEVRGKSGRRWRIRDRGQSGNVDLMPEIGDEREASYCAHPPGSLPAADAHLAQLLYLATDDDEFLRVANCHWRRPAGRAA